MKRTRLTAALLGTSLLVLRSSAGAATMPGCMSTWVVTTLELDAHKGQAIKCVDGDPRCDGDGRRDGHCTFTVATCIGRNLRRGLTCSGQPRFKTRGRRAAILGPTLPAPGGNCSARQSIQIALGGVRTKPRQSRRIRLTTKVPVHKKLRQRHLSLRCLPAAGPAPEVPQCPPNPLGPDQPNELRLTLADSGTDLDLGWTGAFHGFALPAGLELRACLTRCNASSNPTCEASVSTGPGSPNGSSFGPPLPLFAAGLPLCLINEWSARTFAGGMANLVSGDLEQTVGLESRVFVTEDTHVCPRCVDGICDSGANAAGTCSVSGAFTGSRPTEGPSADCPPRADGFVGTIPLSLHLTTATSTLDSEGNGSSTPCLAQAGDPPGVAPLPDACGEAACTDTCTGDACFGPNCVDLKGGRGQQCCASNTARSCFPTATGLLQRTGFVTRPLPHWPDLRYPKLSALTAVATFCVPATAADAVNALVGLPGPGALVAPFNATWLLASGTVAPPPGPAPGPSPY